jgi:hypothetical protein
VGMRPMYISCLNLLGNYVDGIAADWYAADIDNPERILAEPMSFIDAICAMHRRFVRTATANNAVTQYDKIEYNPTDGVEGFYYKLDKMAILLQIPNAPSITSVNNVRDSTRND